MPTNVAERPEREPTPIGPHAARQRPGPPPLPIPLTTLIGRATEVARVRALLAADDVRLVTLVGPGGVGKTRLALQIATEERLAGADVAFCPLAATDEPAQVAAAIAGLLDVRPVVDQATVDALRTAIGPRTMLLVLDNFEQVLLAASLLVDLLGACPNLTLLVTSRTRLRVSGEHVVDVPSLLAPDSNRLPALDELAAYDAIRLFVDRAQASDDTFALNQFNAPAVVAICHRLEGLPLAIELAAASSRLLRPPDILAHLDRSLTLLTYGPRDQPPRLQTMRDAIAWSYRLLNPEQQTLFRRLSVFVGGCTLDAAVGEEAGPTSSVLGALTALVDSSLVRSAVGRGGETRFEMLEMVREFGVEQLARLDEEADARAAHADYVLALAERLGPGMQGPDPWAINRRLEDEVGNIRGALSWLYRQETAEPGLRLTSALYWSWPDAVSFREGRAWLDRFLAKPDVRVAPVLRAKALLVSADLAIWAADFARCRPKLEEALAIFRAAGDRRGIANVLRSLGNMELGLAEYERAEPLLLEAESLARSDGDLWNLGVTLNLLGIVARAMGQPDRSQDYHREARDISRSAGHEVNAMTAVGGVGLAALDLNDLAEARAACLAVLADARPRDDHNPIFRCLLLGGGIAAATGQMRWAVRLLGCAVAVQEERGTPGLPATQVPMDRWLAAARAAIGERQFADAWAAGVALPLEQALDETQAVATAPDAAAPAAATRAAGLTPRELDVLRLLVEGLSDKEIADRFAISRRTVSKHVETILSKLDLPTRTAAATYATRHELV